MMRVTGRHATNLLAFVLAIGCSALPALADDETDARVFLTDAEIRAEVVGFDFKGTYNTGKAWAEDYDVAGSLRYREAGIDIPGYWTLADGVFCTFYRRQLGGGCWRVMRAGKNCYEFYGASQGPGPTATDRAWTARGFKTKEAPGCGEPQIS